jgi:outer membrane biosynthesis protein TonB
LSGFRRFVLAGAIIAAAAGVTKLSAQSVLSDPKDAAKVFASTCSACHKSPQGLAKSGQVAGFLRQHYTTGAEMSAAMAAYLVAAGNGPAGKKGAATATVTPGEEGDAKAKAKEAREKAKEAREARAKKKEQLVAAHPAGEGPGAAAETQKQKQSLRGEQRPAKPQEPETVAHPAPAESAATNPAAEPPAEEQKQTAAAAQSAPATAAGQQSAAGAATTGTPGQVELNIPPPPMPEAAPPELSQSAFSSSPLP